MPKLALVPLCLAAAVLAALGILAIRSDDGPVATAAHAARTRPPVVVLLLDELPPDSLLGRDGRIDSLRFPNFAALAATSTWFRNASTIYDSTPKAIPAILDGRKPFLHEGSDLRDHPHSIYTMFGRLGYRIVDSEEATALCPRRYCRHARSRRPRILRHLAGGRPERLEAWIRSMGPSRRPTVWIKHALLPHQPWQYLPSGKSSRPGWKDTVPGLAGPAGFGDARLTDHIHQRYMLQLGFVDRELGKLMQRLRETGLFDRALIAVVADHGYAFEVGVSDRRKVTSSNVDEIAPVPFFVKAPGQRRGRVDPAYARTIDLVPTIANLLHFRLGYRADGRSAFSRSIRRHRVVRLPTRSFDRIIKIGAAALERRRRANVRHRARLFGSGLQSLMQYLDPWAGVYRVGPHRELMGRPVTDLSVGRATRLRVRLANPGLTRAVRPSSAVAPTQIGGVVTHDRGRPKRDVAVAVNGVIAAVGRTFYLRGTRSEGFDLIVPESTLRPGLNDVRVFEVRGRSLIPLGGN